MSKVFKVLKTLKFKAGIILLGFAGVVGAQGRNDVSVEAGLPLRSADPTELAGPKNEVTWYNKYIENDRSDSLSNMRIEVEKWTEKEQFIDNWNLRDNGAYRDQVVSDSAKKKFLMKQALRFLNKNMVKDLRDSFRDNNGPSTVNSFIFGDNGTERAEVKSEVKLKVKTQAWKGESRVILENPYLEANTVLRINGKVEINLRKTVDSIGVTGEVVYHANENRYIAKLSKAVMANVYAQLSSNNKLSGEDSKVDNIAQLLYSVAF